jgi:hypothetical protein
MEELKKFEQNVDNKLNLYNIQFKKHFFNHENINKFVIYNFKSFDDNELYNYNLRNNNQRSQVILNKLNTLDKTDKTNMFDILKFASFDCKHLFHDEKWLKFTKNNFICDIEDDFKEIYCNTINKSDMKTKYFLDFVDKIENIGYNIKYIDYDDNENEDYNNELLMWIIITIEIDRDL